MKKKLFLLIKYVSKVFKIGRKDSASILLSIFETHSVFSLSDEKQISIIENLISYFRDLIFGIDNLGLNKNTRNKHFSDDEILNHLNNKVQDLVINSKYLKTY